MCLQDERHFNRNRLHENTIISRELMTVNQRGGCALLAGHTTDAATQQRNTAREICHLKCGTIALAMSAQKVLLRMSRDHCASSLIASPVKPMDNGPVTEARKNARSLSSAMKLRRHTHDCLDCMLSMKRVAGSECHRISMLTPSRLQESRRP
jgi:hypothetical protein